MVGVAVRRRAGPWLERALEVACEVVGRGGRGDSSPLPSQQPATASDVHCPAAVALWCVQGLGEGIAASACSGGLALATSMQRALWGWVQAPAPLTSEMAGGCSVAPRVLCEAALQRSSGAVPKVCVWPGVRFSCVCVSIILENFWEFFGD